MRCERLSLLAAFGLLLTSVCARQVLLDRKEPVEIPNGWKLDSPAHEGHEIRLILALKQTNLDRFRQIFEEITDPKSEKYGQYWTIEDLTEMIAPTEEALKTVNEWLDSHFVWKRNMTTNKDFIHVWVTAKQAEEMLGVQYFNWVHDKSGSRMTATLGPYSAPHTVAPHLDFIVGGMGLPRMAEVGDHMHKDLKREDRVPISPSLLRERYNVTRSSIGGNPANMQSVAAFMDNFYSTTDIADFFSMFWPNSEYTDQVTKTVGTNKPSEPTALSSVGVEYIMGVAPNVATWFWSNPGSDFWGDLTWWVNQLTMDEFSPPVHMMSYGNQGVGPSQEYRDRLTVELGKLGGRGISVIVAAGDYGTGCYLCYYFEPSFPATSPWVTAVGATSFSSNKIGPESAAKDFSSGGGFSWHFEQPSYQASVVTHYFATQSKLPSLHYYNPYGRGIPDVSALGSNFQVVINGKTTMYSGTAASTATFSAIVSLLNEIRIAHNQKTLGFLNPWLYAIALEYPDSFYDVTSGTNAHGCCFTGFQSAAGWDPVSGLGTPNYWILSKIVLQKHLGLRQDLEKKPVH